MHPLQRQREVKWSEENNQTKAKVQRDRGVGWITDYNHAKRGKTKQCQQHVSDNKPANEILQDWAFPGALSADHGDLREVQITTLADGAESVLKFVDQGDQVFHPPVPHGCLVRSVSVPLGAHTHTPEASSQKASRC